MVEKARRARRDERRPDADPAWEILARDDETDPPRYVGTVRAEDAATAHEEATRLFCWYADEVWVCPSEEVRKFTTVDAEEPTDDELAIPESGSESRTYEL